MNDETVSAVAGVAATAPKPATGSVFNTGNGTLGSVDTEAQDSHSSDIAPQDESPPLLRTIYDRLSKTIGLEGAQILSLQYPTRYISKEEFQYPLADTYSNSAKPAAVSEAEFRLTDALYDADSIVGAPNGRSLSTVYNQVIENFVPKPDMASRKIGAEREKYRAWLLQSAGNDDFKLDLDATAGSSNYTERVGRAFQERLPKQVNESRKMGRMEFSDKLLQDYDRAQRDWESRRDELIAEATGSQDPAELVEVTRKLGYITQAEQGKLATMNADATVRGYSHIVREALGHLNVKSAAEILQDAKDAFRASAVSSLHGADMVYPVSMSPMDWSAALDTGFAPEDLAEKPDMIMKTMKQKETALDLRKRQLALLQGDTGGDVAALRKELDQAAQQLEQAETDLQAKYTDSMLQLAKIIMAATAPDEASSGGIVDVGVKGVQTTQGEAAKATTELNVALTAANMNDTAEDVINQVKMVDQSQSNLQSKMKAWNSKKSALAHAAAADTTSTHQAIESSIASLDAELVDLNARLLVAQSVREKQTQHSETGNSNANNLAQNRASATGDDFRWQDISIQHFQKYSEKTTENRPTSSPDRWRADFWIASAGSSSELSSETSQVTSTEEPLELNISMKVMLVTLDRSSWFQPQLFDNTKGYIKNNSDTTLTNWPEEKAANDVADEFRKNPTSLQGDNLLPAYPVGYILCKDVTITVAGDNYASSSLKSQVAEKSQTSSGFLCFSYSKSSETQADSSRAAFLESNNGLTVRILGPQILGYIQQIVPTDLSSAY